MAYGFLDIATTPSVRAAQAANGSAGLYDKARRAPRASIASAETEAAFIAARDSFYMASVSETGWPYVQHRGGPPGFLKVIDEKTLAFADFRGNRQYISLGNITAERPRRADPDGLSAPPPAEALCAGSRRATSPPIRRLPSAWRCPAIAALPERAFLLHLEAFDWNCPQHITPRFTEAEIAAALAPLRARLAALEAENARAARCARRTKEPPA